MLFIKEFALRREPVGYNAEDTDKVTARFYDFSDLWNEENSVFEEEVSERDILSNGHYQFSIRESSIPKNFRVAGRLHAEFSLFFSP